MKAVAPEEWQSVDEQIIPFKGRSPLKQCMKSKPHNWGYKVFTRAGVSRIMHDFIIYEVMSLEQFVYIAISDKGTWTPTKGNKRLRNAARG
ncbi:hypothetical protein MRX96_006920 [Rhipicephalus microplus]